jgi:hypothetical protein
MTPLEFIGYASAGLGLARALAALRHRSHGRRAWRRPPRRHRRPGGEAAVDLTAVMELARGLPASTTLRYRDAHGGTVTVWRSAPQPSDRLGTAEPELW